MNLDVRIPLGMMFAMIGAVLAAFGLATRAKPEFHAASLGMNVDLWWGVALLVFGMIVIGMGRRGQGRIEQKKLAKR